MILSVCKRRSYEASVQNDLAMTPPKMAELTRLGLPVVSGVSAADFVDSSPGHEPPREYERGVDINDLWNDMLTSRKKAKKLEFEPENVE